MADPRIYGRTEAQREMQVEPIAVNGRFLSRIRAGRITGVERYALEITRRLENHLRLLEPKRPLSAIEGHLWEQFGLPHRLSKNDLLWSPANTGPIAVRSQVLTLHDISPIDHPGWFSARFALWYRLLLGLLLPRVAATITSSSFSKGRIEKVFRLAPERVYLVPVGVDLNQFQPVTGPSLDAIREKYRLERPYLLFVGSLQPRKNLARLLQAWQRILEEVSPVELLLVGGSGPAFSSLHNVAVPARVRTLGRVADADLAGLYSGARAFIQPSLYEGAALTLLEAMACGCPTLTSDLPVLREAAVPESPAFDPQRVASMTAAIRLVLSDEGLRRRLARLNLRRASDYSWDFSAAGVLDVLETVRSRMS